MAPQVPAQPSPMDVFWAAPPFSRTITALTLTISVLVYSKLLSAYWVILHMPYLLKIPPQLWRLFTSFMLTDPELSIIFDSYFREHFAYYICNGVLIACLLVYTYGSKLETGSPRFAQPSDFYTYIIFLWVTIIGLNMIFTGAVIFTSALILALTYTACQDDRLSKVRFFVVTIPATWVPLAMLFLTIVIRGPGAAKVQATGLVAAHAHDFLSNIYRNFGGGANILQTPDFVKRFFAIRVPQVVHRAYGTAITNPEQPRGQAASTAKSSSSEGSVLPESWRSRGTGHRLGGD